MSRSFGATSFTTRPPIRIVPAVRFLEPRDETQDSRLAAAGRTDEHQELPIVDAQIEVFDDGDRTEMFGDAFAQHMRHGDLVVERRSRTCGRDCGDATISLARPVPQPSGRAMSGGVRQRFR